MKIAKGTAESAPPSKGSVLKFKDGQGAVLDFADEVVRHEATKAWAGPAECKRVQYETLKKKSRKLNKNELTYVGALYCSTMQMLLSKGWVYANDETASTGRGRLRKLVTREPLNDSEEPLLLYEWTQDSTCLLLKDLKTGGVEFIVLTAEGKWCTVDHVTWCGVFLPDKRKAAWSGSQRQANASKHSSIGEGLCRAVHSDDDDDDFEDEETVGDDGPLKTKLKVAERENASLRGAKLELGTTLTDAENAREAAENENADLRAANAKLVGSTRSMGGKIQTLKGALSDAEAARGEAETETAKLRAAMVDMQKLICTLEDKNRALEDKNRPLKDKNRTLEDKNRTLEDKNRILEDEYRTLEDKIQKKLSAADDESGALRSSFAALEEQALVLDTERKAAVRDMKSAVKERNQAVQEKELAVHERDQAVREREHQVLVSQEQAQVQEGQLREYESLVETSRVEAAHFRREIDNVVADYFRDARETNVAFVERIKRMLGYTSLEPNATVNDASESRS
jgi:hypothetical protein